MTTIHTLLTISGTLFIVSCGSEMMTPGAQTSNPYAPGGDKHNSGPVLINALGLGKPKNMSDEEYIAKKKAERRDRIMNTDTSADLSWYDRKRAQSSENAERIRQDQIRRGVIREVEPGQQ
ncbi:MAG: hypothetical protein AB8D78_15090 [Akkermansiaceae bacterium]